MYKSIDFKGIVRATSAQNNADGNCEEIINLRQKAGVWRTTGKKRAIVEDVNYEQVFVHEYGGFKNYVGVKEGRVIWFDPVTKEEKQEILLAEEEIALEQLNNILLVKGNNGITTCIFANQRYSSVGNYPELPHFYFSTSDKETVTSEEYIINCDASKGNEENEHLIAKFVKEKCELFLAEQKDRKKIEGYAFVRMTYQLFDGTEVMHTPPRMLEFGDNTFEISGYTAIDAGGAAGHTIGNGNVTFKELLVAKSGSIHLNISDKLRNLLQAKFKGVIHKINVYVTPLVSHVDLGALEVKCPGMVDDWLIHSSGYKRDLEKYFNSLMYYRVASIDIESTKIEPVKLDYDLFQEITTNPDIPSDNMSRTKRNGNMFVYNKRLHLFNISTEIVPLNEFGYYFEEPYVEGTPPVTGNLVFKPCYARFIISEGFDTYAFISSLRATYYTRNREDGFRVWGVKLPPLVAYPDTRVTKIELMTLREGATGSNLSDYVVFKRLTLKPSEKYDFAYCFVDTPFESKDFETFAPEPAGNSIYKNTSQIIVSAQSNPTVFPPEHSYTVDGEILNLAVNTQQISASQIGQFPLYAFTTEGIFALQVGDGKVLYSNIIPVSAEVAVAGSSVLQTKYGVVFVTKDGLKVISGTEVTDISEPLIGSLDMGIRNCAWYRYAVCAGFSGYVSSARFEEYIQKAVLGYDIAENEVIVSNPAYNYSYVYNLDTKNWHKITEVFSSFNRHVALRQNGEPAKAAVASFEILDAGEMFDYDRAALITDKRIVNKGSLVEVVLLDAGGNVVKSLSTRTEKTERMFRILKDMSLPEKEVWIFDYIEGFLKIAFTGDMAVSVFSAEIKLDGNVIQAFEIKKENDIRKMIYTTGQTIKLSVGGYSVEHELEKQDYSDMVTYPLYSNLGYSRKLKDGNRLIFFADPGKAGNDTPISFEAPEGADIDFSPFSGGADAVRFSVDVCDIREEVKCEMPVFLQMRPFSLDSYGFKKLEHAVLHGDFRPGAGSCCNVFFMVSDNLSYWAKGTGLVFRDDHANVCVERCPYSSRYFAMLFSGKVRSETSLALIEAECKEKFDNRLR